MGMYDEIRIHDKFLSDELKGKDIIFQTKSLYNELFEFVIDENGNLMVNTDHESFHNIESLPPLERIEKGYKKVEYIGEIRCHGYTDSKRATVILWCVKGNIKDKVVYIEEK
jgi:hypothetical protein